MEDREILDCIYALVAQERRLRDQRDRGGLPDHDGGEHLADVKANLDEMWDLLRRRRALREAGLDPDVVDLRSPVEISLAS